MYLKQLHYFISVAETKSFTKAAKIHFIVQTSMSQQISSLENDIGTPLFIRSNRNVELTPAGEAFYKEIKPLAVKLEDAIKNARELANEDFTRLLIGISKYIDNSFIIPVIKQFSTDHSNIKIKVMVDEETRLQEAFIKNDCDILILSETQLQYKKDLNITKVSKQPAYPCSVVVYPSHSLACKDSVTWEDLKDQQLILYSSFPEPASDYHHCHLLRNCSFDYKITSTIHNVETLQVMVEAETGIAILPGQLCTCLGIRLKAIPIIDRDPEYEDIVIVRHNGNRKKEVVEFVNLAHMLTPGNYL